MKRVLIAISALVLAAGGVLIFATPAAAAVVAACVVSEEQVTIDTDNNTATIEYELYCPVQLGEYEAPGTATCTGEGSGDQSSVLLAWTNTEDECHFYDNGGYVGVVFIDMSRQFVLAPLSGLGVEAGAGVALEGIFEPSVQNSDVPINYFNDDDELIMTNVSVSAPFVIVDEL